MSNEEKTHTDSDVRNYLLDFEKNFSGRITADQYIKHKKIFQKSKKNIQVDFEKLRVLFNDITNKKTRVIPDIVKKAIVQRLSEGFTKEDIKLAIFNCYSDPYHIENKHKFLTLEFISRPAILLRFSTMKSFEYKETQQDRSSRLMEKEKAQWG